MTIRRIFDSVHGFIQFNDLESALIDTLAFQRLRYIHQLGGTYLVYPGATHTRFEHSLGVMELASRVFDRVASSIDLPNPTYARQIVRLAALCHDLGHLPFSHVAEHLLLGKAGHEQWTIEIMRSPWLMPIWDRVSEQFPGQNVAEDIVKLAVGEKKLRELSDAFMNLSTWDRALGQIITGDFFGADRIDYLLRDARCTGVSYGLFDYHQLIETVRILPSISDPLKLEMGVEENGVQACEALLVARHFMHKRVYQYATVKSYAFHLARFMQQLLQEEILHADLGRYLFWTDNEVLSCLQKAATDPSLPGHCDAMCLIDRKQRFRSFNLPTSFCEQYKKEILLQLSPTGGAIEWELGCAAKQPYEFPVLRRGGAVVSCAKCLQVVIPSHHTTWVYVSPSLVEPFEQFLERSM